MSLDTKQPKGYRKAWNGEHRPDVTPTIDEQIAELRAAGWEPTKRPTVWRSPNGYLYLGPHGAWKIMKADGEGGR